MWYIGWLFSHCGPTPGLLRGHVVNSLNIVALPEVSHSDWNTAVFYVSQLRLLFEKTAKIRSHRIPRVFCLYFQLQLFFSTLVSLSVFGFFSFSPPRTLSPTVLVISVQRKTHAWMILHHYYCIVSKNQFIFSSMCLKRWSFQLYLAAAWMQWTKAYGRFHRDALRMKLWLCCTCSYIFKQLFS